MSELLPVRAIDPQKQGERGAHVGMRLSDCPYPDTALYAADRTLWQKGFLLAIDGKAKIPTMMERGAKAYFDGEKMVPPVSLTANEREQWATGWCKALSESYTKTGKVVSRPKIAPMSLWFRTLAYEVEPFDVVRMKGGGAFRVIGVGREGGFVRLGSPGMVTVILKYSDPVEVRQLPVRGGV